MPLYHNKINIQNISAIPESFSSNTSIAGYVCSASLTDGSNYPWKIWTQNYTTSEWAWWPGSVSLPQWIQIEVPESFIPSAFMIMNEISSPENLREGIFQGSNDEEIWDDLYHIYEWNNTAGHKQIIQLQTKTAYKYFRLYIISGWSSENGVSIQAMQIFKKEIKNIGFDEFGHSIEYNSAEDANCNNVIMPKKGLVFYASLNGKTPDYAETKQSMSVIGTNIVYQKINGIDCGYFNNSRLSTSEIVSWNNVTLSAWLRSTNNGTSTSTLHIGADSSNQMFKIGESNGLPFVSRYSTVDETVDISISNQFRHVLATYNGNIINFYIDGELKKTINNTGSISSSYITIGADNNFQYKFNGYIAATRIYNRILTEKEIKILSKEFKIEGN